VLREGKSPGLQYEDPPSAGGISIDEVLSENGSKRAAADDDDLERARHGAGKRLIEPVADIAPEHITVKSVSCTVELVGMAVSLRGCWQTFRHVLGLEET
jgi:hypothetical protein